MGEELTKEQWEAVAEKLAEWCEKRDWGYITHWDKEKYILEAKKELGYE